MMPVRKLPMIDWASNGAPAHANGCAVEGEARKKFRARVSDLSTRFEVDEDAALPVPRTNRPTRRGDCLAGGINEERPCPWVGCRHHLAIDVHPKTGTMRIASPNKEPWELAHTCALDVADKSAEDGGLPLQDVGEAMNITREYVRQLEESALISLTKTHLVQKDFKLFREEPMGAYTGESQSVAQAVIDAGGLEDEWGYGTRPEVVPYACGRSPRWLDAEEDVAQDWLWSRMLRREREREAEANGDHMLINGVPITPKCRAALEFIRVYMAQTGRGPSGLEIADAIEVEGSNDAQRGVVTRLLAPLREMGIVKSSIADGYTLGDAPVSTDLLDDMAPEP